MDRLKRVVRWTTVGVEVAGFLTLLFALAPLALKAGGHYYAEVARVTTREYPAGYAGEDGPGWVQHSVSVDESLLAAVASVALIASGRGMRHLTLKMDPSDPA